MEYLRTVDLSKSLLDFGYMYENSSKFSEIDPCWGPYLEKQDYAMKIFLRIGQTKCMPETY